MEPPEVVVVGAGAIGVATTYYLAKKGIRVAVVERTGVACAASGKAGGFLAKDWCDGGPLQELARKSFQLHAELAQEFGNPWEYRRLRTVSVQCSTRHKRAVPNPRTPWLDGASSKEQELGASDTTAQVTPAKFVAALLDAAKANGATLITDEVTGVVRKGEDREEVVGVRLREGGELRAAKVVLAMGPWTGRAKEWMEGIPDVQGDKAHSVVLQPPRGDVIDATAVFIGYSDKGKMEHPEIYPRPDGTVYVCGCGDNTPLPATADDVAPSAARCHDLCGIAGRLVSELDGVAPSKQQACYLPISPTGTPVLGPVCAGLYVAAGHSCWGILNAPATGMVMAELLAGEEPSVDISAFAPRV